ncbi:MAG: hypothetical protein M3171_12575 [Actinomycetota bacterium]|nr:hypothetical protein [Actinomycetota bacterium]
MSSSWSAHGAGREEVLPSGTGVWSCLPLVVLVVLVAYYFTETVARSI